MGRVRSYRLVQLEQFIDVINEERMNPRIVLSKRGLTVVIYCLASLALTAHGQEKENQFRSDPLNSKAVVQGLHYQSSLLSFRPFIEQEVRLWRESNDITLRVGGWRVYAKQAQEPDVVDSVEISKSKGTSALDPAQKPILNREQQK